MSDQNFFLYDQLFEQNKTLQKLTSTETIEAIRLLRKLDKAGTDIVFVLIRVHSLRNNECKNFFDIPFKGEKLNEVYADKNTFDVKFDFKNIPPTLQRILYCFAKRHIEQVQASV
jgi:hypothetical protein